MKSEFNLIKDLNVLCNIPVTTLQSLSDLAVHSICGDVLDTIDNKEAITTIDIGIGTLNILINNDEIKFKFVPSNLLAEGVADTIKHRINPIEEDISKTISDKIKRTYKELF